MANVQLSKNLCKYRKAFGLTQAKLSQILNISRQAYSNYETGKRDPDLDLLIKLSDIYKISLDQLVHQPYADLSTIIRERKPPFIPAIEKNSSGTIYLSKEELSLLIKFREAEEEKRYVISQILEKS